MEKALTLDRAFVVQEVVDGFGQGRIDFRLGFGGWVVELVEHLKN
jgi:hypothetical protein